MSRQLTSCSLALPPCYCWGFFQVDPDGCHVTILVIWSHDLPSLRHGAAAEEQAQGPDGGGGASVPSPLLLEANVHRVGSSGQRRAASSRSHHSHMHGVPPPPSPPPPFSQRGRAAHPGEAPPVANPSAALQILVQVQISPLPSATEHLIAFSPHLHLLLQLFLLLAPLSLSCHWPGPTSRFEGLPPSAPLLRLLSTQGSREIKPLCGIN